ncbi:phosphate ABC transporter substrate-binding protein [Aliiglaciecola sp. CAU 1673]|uniref:phosphate ABC transporter substrate-binding protein n=1 Tax=Aliiglaciecola sp. CAU 1673 TaxID=3032595 RepID=UPI0023DCBE47|nr:phosphate ABC transporter substrate-binding protein [Aliiglaciecola sp. CAU 1673]MDF2179155.1 phosphate ABC transporter substrate-binding protein [Aliiglaciecola sp. CAU 1673]
MKLSRFRSLQGCLSLVFTAGIVFAPALRADIAIIAHPSNNNSLSAKDVERLFTGKTKSFADGTKAEPLNLVSSQGNREAFDQQYLGRSTTQVSAFWSQQIFTGKGMPPKEVGSDAEMLKEISSNPNAIGYVDRAAVDGSVKVMTIN